MGGASSKTVRSLALRSKIMGFITGSMRPATLGLIDVPLGPSGGNIDYPWRTGSSEQEQVIAPLEIIQANDTLWRPKRCPSANGNGKDIGSL